MPTELQIRAPRVRCHRCGSDQVVSVCHHCAVPMCAEHRPVRIVRNRPWSYEFADLNLDHEGPEHCGACSHRVRSDLREPFAGGVVTAVVGVLLLLFGPLRLGLVFFLVGAVVASGSQLVGRRRRNARRAAGTPVPLVPSIDSVRIDETLGGAIQLDARGAYANTVQPVRGVMSLALSLGQQDRDRLARHLRLHRLPDATGVAYSAGSILLRGRAGVKLKSDGVPATVMPLTGAIADLPFFADPDRRAAHRWPIEMRYGLLHPDRIAGLPLRLTPSLSPKSDQRSLELELSWTGFEPDTEPPAVVRIEQLLLQVPETWGLIEQATLHWGDDDTWAVGGSGLSPVTGAQEPLRAIEWSHIWPDRLFSRGDDLRPRARHRRLRVSVRFERRVNLSDSIRGRADIEFEGAISGLEGIRLTHPLGAVRRTGPRQLVRTRVAADFELSLVGIRYQDLRVVPDRQRSDDRERPETRAFPGVIPDHDTIIDLTNSLSDQGYYVKRMVENQPRNAPRPNTLNRDWDITGRRYDGVYPIDFHIVLTGDEQYDGDVRACSGNSLVRMAVQGAYASERMEREIVREWQRLDILIQEVLAKRAPASPAAAEAARADWLRDQLKSLELGYRSGWISSDDWADLRSRLDRGQPS